MVLHPFVLVPLQDISVVPFLTTNHSQSAAQRIIPVNPLYGVDGLGHITNPELYIALDDIGHVRKTELALFSLLLAHKLFFTQSSSPTVS
jgi:hypothetical protein